MKSKPWTCAHCKEPLGPHDYILVMDSESGGHPRRATPEEVPFSEILDAVDLLSLKPPEPQVKFLACHQVCDPKPGIESYCIHAGRAETLEAWCGWVHHLHEKTWMGKYDLGRMLNFWFVNRDINIHTL